MSTLLYRDRHCRLGGGRDGHSARRPGGGGLPGAVHLQRQLNDLRSNLLDEREKRIRRQQGFDRLVILVLGIAIGIGGIWAKSQDPNRQSPARDRRGCATERAFAAAPHRLLPGRTYRPVPLLGPAEPETGPGSETGLVPDSAGLDTARAADAWIWSGELPDFAVDEAAERQRHEEAIADCIEAIRLDPDDAAAYFGRSEAKAELGRYDEAIEDFDRGVRLEPNIAPASEGR